MRALGRFPLEKAHVDDIERVVFKLVVQTLHDVAASLHSAVLFVVTPLIGKDLGLMSSDDGHFHRRQSKIAKILEACRPSLMKAFWPTRRSLRNMKIPTVGLTTIGMKSYAGVAETLPLGSLSRHPNEKRQEDHGDRHCKSEAKKMQHYSRL